LRGGPEFLHGVIQIRRQTEVKVKSLIFKTKKEIILEKVGKGIKPRKNFNHIEKSKKVNLKKCLSLTSSRICLGTSGSTRRTEKFSSWDLITQEKLPC